MFYDREDAGRQLAEKLKKYIGENIVLIAIPRGGLPLGAVASEQLQAPLDVALSKKIGHPYNREYAIGAVSMQDRILTDATGVTKSYIEEETHRVREELQKRHRQYYRNSKPISLTDKTVIIIDDGMATGNTILVTIALVAKQKPSRIVVAVPVASKSAVQKVRKTEHVDEVVCLHTPFDFNAVGQYYSNFPQVTDEEAIEILSRHKEVSP